jgi:uncharacterized low-complexity protein
MKKLFLGLMTVFAFMAFSTPIMATTTTDSTYVQTQNDDEKCGSGKCGSGKCGSGKCGGE